MATSDPVTLATNMMSNSSDNNCAGLPGDDQFFVGRHDPDLHAAGLRR